MCDHYCEDVVPEEQRCPTAETVQLFPWDDEGQMYFPEVVPEEEPLPTGSKNRRKIRLLQIGIAAVLAVTALLVSLILMTAGPLREIASAVHNTLEKEKMTIEYHSYANGKLGTGVIQLEVDLSERKLMLLTEGSSANSRRVAICDGYLIVESGGIAIAQNISARLNDLFDTYEDLQNKGLNAKKSLSVLELLIKNPEAYFAPRTLEQCTKDYLRSLNNEKWLQHYAGFEKERGNGVTSYRFNPDLYEFIVESITHLEEAFLNPEDYTDLLKKLETVEPGLRAREISLSIGVESDVLSYVKVRTGEAKEFLFDFVTVGDSELDADQLEEMLDSAIIVG